MSRRTLLVGQHHQGLSAGDAGQPVRAQRCVRRHEHRRRDQRRRGVGRMDQPAAQFLHHDHRLDGPGLQTAVLVGHGQGAQAEFGQFLPDLARVPARAGRGVAPLEGESPVHPARHRFAQRGLIIGEVEVHA
jgi:hypothetical protein